MLRSNYSLRIQLQHCPKVVINGTEHIGQMKILSALSKLNEKARSEIPTANSQLEHQNVST